MTTSPKMDDRLTREQIEEQIKEIQKMSDLALARYILKNLEFYINEDAAEDAEQRDRHYLAVTINLIRSAALRQDSSGGEPFCWYRVTRDIADEYVTVYSEDEERPKGEGWQPLYAAPQESRSEVLEDETGWLVELQVDGAFRGWIHGGEVDHLNTFGWTTDPNKAIRFCRKQDADAFRARFGFTSESHIATHFSTEHVWLDFRAEPGAPSTREAVEGAILASKSPGRWAAPEPAAPLTWKCIKFPDDDACAEWCGGDECTVTAAAPEPSVDYARGLEKLVEVHRGWCNYCKGNAGWCDSCPEGGCSLRDYLRSLKINAAEHR